ncbi:hypothetical protein Hdeb2414_s0010g00344281 [Helianthus debilis subsp. tardiflorus]
MKRLTFAVPLFRQGSEVVEVPADEGQNVANNPAGLLSTVEETLVESFQRPHRNCCQLGPDAWDEEGLPDSIVGDIENMDRSYVEKLQVWCRYSSYWRYVTI